MKRTIRLRSLLLLLAAIAVAPGMVALIYSSVVVQRDEIAKARAELESVTNLVAANQEQLIEGVRQILATVASGPSVRRNDLHALCVEFLRNVQAATPSYANIGLLDLHGNVECHARDGEASGNASSRQYFQDAIRSGSFSVGSFGIGLTTGRKVVSFGMPVYDYTGTLRGVAFAGLDLAYANAKLKSIALPKPMHITISDALGRVLVSGSDVDEVGALIADPALRAAMLAERPLQLDAVDPQGRAWLHALMPIGEAGRHGLMVAVSLRRTDAVAVANTHFQTQLAGMAAASLIGFLLAWFFARRSLEQPVAYLIERMRRIEQGHAVDSADSPLASAELVALEAGFSSMLIKLQTNQQQLIKAQAITRVGFFQLDIGANVYTGSPILYEIFGIEPRYGPVTAARIRELIHPADLPQVTAHHAALFAGGDSDTRFQYRVVRTDGSICWVDSFGMLERNQRAEPLRYSGAVQDITQRKLAEEALRANENRFRLLFENSLDGVMQTRLDGTILGANSAALAMFGMSEAELIARGRLGVVAQNDPRLAPMLVERNATGRTRGELSMVRGDGSVFEVEVSSSVYLDSGGDQVCSLVVRDITARLKTEQDIHRLAFFDALTGLPNRRLLIDRLEAALTAARSGLQIGAVLFIDLDHFKNVNDARGHAIGDALLRQVGLRLTGLVRGGDTVARIGGDEFVILMPALATDFTLGAQHAMVVAEKIREAMAEPFFIDGQPYGSGASIGVTILPKPQQTTEDLLREADTAMYRAKTSGRNRIAFYESAMQAEVEERLGLEHDLAQAIGTAQLSMVLQPQFDHDAQPVGCELLMRWTHPERGAVPPALFIPVAEDCGLILRLGDWVVREGCRIALRLQAAGCPMPVSVNVSPRQFRQADFVARVRAILEETGAPARLLIFEVTEGLLIENVDDTIVRMQELVALGIRLSIDDFGTGYSSLSYVRRLPLYELKIDRSFVQDTPADAGRVAIVRSILSLANHLGLRVVAEGVETQAQAAFLRLAGCGCMQGYLLARPMPLEAWLRLRATTLV